MILHFYIRYATKFGQSLFVTGNTAMLGNNHITKPFALAYLNDQLWHGSVEIADKDLIEPVCYKVQLAHQS